MKLSKTKIKEIRVWLKNKDRYECPFKSSRCEIGAVATNICKKGFPRTRKKPASILHNSGLAGCPCGLYTLGYVIKKAKQMVETGEV